MNQENQEIQAANAAQAPGQSMSPQPEPAAAPGTAYYGGPAADAAPFIPAQAQPPAGSPEQAPGYCGPYQPQGAPGPVPPPAQPWGPAQPPYPYASVPQATPQAVAPGTVYYGGPAANAAPFIPAQAQPPAGSPAQAPGYCGPYQPQGAPGPVPLPAQPSGPAQPPYSYAPPPVPSQACGYAPPPSYAVKSKDPRKTNAVRDLNTMSVLVAVMTMLSLLIQSVVVYACMSAGLDLSAPSQGLALAVMTVAMSPLCTASPCLGYMLFGGRRRDWNYHLRFQKVGPFSLVLVLGGLGLCLLANFPAAGVDALLESLGASEPASGLGQGKSWSQLAVELLGVAVLVPLVEEFAFRGVIFSGLRRFGTGFAVVGSALIFGFAHLSPSSVVFATLAGAVMVWLYAVTGNLWVSVAIHMLNNALAVLGEYAGFLAGPDNMALLENILLFGPMALGLLAALLGVTLWRKRLKSLFSRNFREQSPLGWPSLKLGESARCLARSLVLWGLLFIVILYTLCLFL